MNVTDFLTLIQGTDVDSIEQLSNKEGFYSYGMSACVTVILLWNYDLKTKVFKNGRGLHCAGGLELLATLGRAMDHEQASLRKALMAGAGHIHRSLLFINAGTDYATKDKRAGFIKAAEQLHKEMAPWMQLRVSDGQEIIVLKNGAAYRGKLIDQYLRELDMYEFSRLNDRDYK
jgi:hypothetical protein